MGAVHACWYNRGTMKKTLWLILLLALALSGCGSGSDSPEQAISPEASAAPLVTPYHTATPLTTLAPTLTPTTTPTPPPLPTPTPFIHTIAEGETMIGIAAYYGVSLDALSVANPEVNANYLSVGAQLVIPLETTGEDDEDLPASTDPEVLPVTGGEVSCLSNPAGGMWCFWPVTNSTSQPVENLAGVIHLYDSSGEAQWSKPAYSLVNLVKPGETIPLGAYFKPPLPEWSAAQGQITSAAAANQVDVRYLAVTVSDFESSLLDAGALVSQVSGVVAVPGGENAPQLDYLWVLAVAYDQDDQVVGMRRWEAAMDEITGGQVGFEFKVYSQAGPIARVVLLAEARAAGE